MKNSYDFTDVIFYIINFNDDYLNRTYTDEKIENARELILIEAHNDADKFKGVLISEGQFKSVCANYRNKIKTLIQQ